MSTITQTWSADSTITIPSSATSVTFTIHGGKGGKGGNGFLPPSTYFTGGNGGRGQKITGSLFNVAGETLTLRIGSNGSDHTGSTNNGANGGGGYWNGGAGGNDENTSYPSFGNANPGGGGGGCTAILLVAVPLVAAGGGGGGGAAHQFSPIYDTNGKTSTALGNTSALGSSGEKGDAGRSYSNGGGGGGGGGYPGGEGGFAFGAGFKTSGDGGTGGGGYYNSTYVGSSAAVETSDLDGGSITIVYTTPPNYGAPAPDTLGSLVAVDSFYRNSWPSGWTNWHNHLHSTATGPGSNWTKYADNDFYFFKEADGDGTNGETMKQVNRYYNGVMENHISATTDAAPDSSYNDEGAQGYIFQNDGTNRTALYRFYKNYTASNGYGQATTSGTLTTVVSGIVKRVKLRSGIGGAANVISCNNSSPGIFCYVENYRDTNTSSDSSGCSYPSSGYTNVGFSNITGSGSGLLMHIRITPVNGTGGKPNNMRVTYPGTWYNSGGGSFGDGGVYVSGGSGYAVGDVLNPITTCANMGTAQSQAFEVTEIGSTSTSQTIVSALDRIDHRCGTTNIGGVDGWVYEGIMGYVPSKRGGCTDSTANNYDEFATYDDSSCEYVSAPTVSNFECDKTAPVATQTFTLSWDVADGGSAITEVKIFNQSTSFEEILATTALSVDYSFPAGTAEGTEYTYKVVVTNAEGSSEATVKVTCGLATTATFTAIPTTPLISGNTVKLDWAVVGSYTSLTVTGVTSPTAVGNATFSPTTNTTYTLTVTGSKVENGSLSIDIPVTVYNSASINAFTFNKTIITTPNTSVILSWNVTGDTDTVKISPALPGKTVNTNHPKSGSATLTYPNVETLYTITVTGDGVDSSGPLTRNASIPIYLDDTDIAEGGVPKAWNIPKRAQQVTVTLAAAKGGTGGNDSGASGGDGGKGRGSTSVLPFRELPYVITISPGSNGGIGTDNGKVGGGGGALGGAGYPAGGNGGHSGPSGWSGGGGGGGGATIATDSFWGDVIIIAGGGGGGGGSSWDTGKASNGGDGSAWTSWNPATSGAIGLNLNPGDAGAQNPYDGGGGGGGGGGAGLLGGGGGSFGTDKNAVAGGGGGGSSYFRVGAIQEITNNFVNNSSGWGDVTYIPSDWIPDAFTITPQNPTPKPGPGDTAYSDFFTITGINYPVIVLVETAGAQIQKSGTSTWSTSLPASNGDAFRLRFKTPTSGGVNDAGYSLVSTIIVKAGLIDDEPDDVISADWEVTTRDPDITPDPFSWSDSTENTPALNSNIESENIVITDFEIPLEIKSNYPIQVQIGNDGVWRDVGQIT